MSIQSEKDSRPQGLRDAIKKAADAPSEGKLDYETVRLAFASMAEVLSGLAGLAATLAHPDRDLAASLGHFGAGLHRLARVADHLRSQEELVP